MSKFNSQLPKIALKLNKVKYGKGLKLGGWPFIYRFAPVSYTHLDVYKRQTISITWSI